MQKGDKNLHLHLKASVFRCKQFGVEYEAFFVPLLMDQSFSYANKFLKVHCGSHKEVAKKFDNNIFWMLKIYSD